MNLIAYSECGNALFARRCRTKDEAMREVVFNPWKFRIVYVIYKTKKYTLKEVLKWDSTGRGKKTGKK